jgi:hypothetical protein
MFLNVGRQSREGAETLRGSPESNSTHFSETLELRQRQIILRGTQPQIYKMEYEARLCGIQRLCITVSHHLLPGTASRETHCRNCK